MCNFGRTLNIHPLFVVSVAVLIINTHKCSVFISDKTPHTNKLKFYRYKVPALDALSIICNYKEILMKVLRRLIVFSAD